MGGRKTVHGLQSVDTAVDTKGPHMSSSRMARKGDMGCGLEEERDELEKKESNGDAQMGNSELICKGNGAVRDFVGYK